MVKDANGNEIVETPPAAPAVPAEGAVDEHGVPWKNRSLENERKLKALEEERTNLNQQLEEARRAIPEAPPVEEEQPWEAQARKLAREEYNKERAAGKAVDAKLGLMESDATYGDAVKLYRRQIEDRVAQLDISLRTNPVAIERTAKMVIGENLADLKERWGKPASDGVQRRLTPAAGAPDPVNTGGANGSPSGAGASAGELTPEESDFADRRGYTEDKGYTVSDIKLRYKKAQDRKK